MIVRKNGLRLCATIKWVKTKALREKISFEVARKSVFAIVVVAVVSSEKSVTDIGCMCVCGGAEVKKCSAAAKTKTKQSKWLDRQLNI